MTRAFLNNVFSRVKREVQPKKKTESPKIEKKPTRNLSAIYLDSPTLGNAKEDTIVNDSKEDLKKEDAKEISTEKEEREPCVNSAKTEDVKEKRSSSRNFIEEACKQTTTRGQIWLRRVRADKDQGGPRGGPVTYQQIMERLVSIEVVEQIEKDLSRTYPQYEMFQRGEIQGKMYNILKSVAAFRPSLGYLQGMGYVAGMLITVMTEEDAFWFMIAFIDKFDMEGYWGGSLPWLSRSFYVLERLIEQTLPKLHEHMKTLEIRTSSYATPWFVTLFLSNYSIEFSLRLWDMILMEGTEYMYVISMSLFTMHQEAMLNMDLADILQFLQFSMKKIENESNVEELLRMCTCVKHKVEPKISSLHRKYEDGVKRAL